MTASIGISLAPIDGDDTEMLLKHADVAMYKAKLSGRNTYQFYSSGMGDKAHMRLTLETDLRYALERDQFLLHYQPQVDINSGKIIGMEALLRWLHPELGLIPPAEFIPLLEETGMILATGEWVLRTACTDTQSWRSSRGIALRMSVNLSGQQFADPGLAHVLENI